MKMTIYAKYLEETITNLILNSEMKDTEAIPILERILKQLRLAKMIDNSMKDPKYKKWLKEQVKKQGVWEESK